MSFQMVDDMEIGNYLKDYRFVEFSSSNTGNSVGTKIAEDIFMWTYSDGSKSLEVGGWELESAIDVSWFMFFLPEII